MVSDHNTQNTLLMLHFETAGDPFTRGRQQGEATRDLTQHWMSDALAGLSETRGDASVGALIESTREPVERWLSQWRAISPAGVDECQGIAAGLGWEWDRYATALCHHRLSGDLPQCTLVGHRSVEGHPIFGKTDDIGLHQLGLNVMEVSRPDDGHAHVHFHFAGTPFTTAGANTPGLMMGMTGIPGPMADEEGLFSLMALHTVLPRCATVGDVIDHLGPLPVNAYGFSLMLADAEGDFALLEKTGAGMTVTRGGDEPLAHTNHILDQQFATKNPPQAEPILSNGQHRYETATRRTMAGDEIAEILADRSATGAICQQGEGDLHTDFAILFDAVGRKLTLWSGYPGVVEPEVIDVVSLLN